MPRPSNSSQFYHPKKLGEKYRSLSSSLCSFLHSLVTSSLLAPNILNTLFSNTLSLRSSPQYERPSFTPIRDNRQNYTYFIFTLPQIARRRVISFFPQILQFGTSRISRMGNPCAVPVNMWQERVY